jgi:mersacidin/lichenicidin family type 2 lantibiotic
MIMTSEQIVSSWKNEDYRLSLSVDEQALMPENPAGLIELTDEELLGIDGGTGEPTAFCPISTIIASLTMSVQISILRFCPGD